MKNDKDTQLMREAYEKTIQNPSDYMQDIAKKFMTGKKEPETDVQPAIEERTNTKDKELHKQCIVALQDLLKALYPGDVPKYLPKVDWLISQLQNRIDI